MTLLSVVIACFNEEETLPKSLPIIWQELKKSSSEFELLMIDDGSDDDTYKTLQKYKGELESPGCQFRIIKLRKNVGHMNALRCGIRETQGDWIVTMDADLQDPPSLIRKLMEAAEIDNTCYVQAVRKSRTSDSFFKQLSASVYYKILGFFLKQTIPQAADFRLVHRCIRDEINNMAEQNLVFRLILPSLYPKPSLVYFDRETRVAGKTKYPFRKMVALALDSFLTFGIRPLKIILKVGISLAIFTFLLGIIQIIVWLTGNSIKGIPTVVIPMLFLNSFMIISLGILGEYLGIVLEETRGRSIYRIEDCPRRIKKL